MNDAVSNDVVSGSENSCSLLLLGGQVQLLSRKVILWLSNIHPVSWQDHLEDLTLIGHLWEDFSLDGSWLGWDSIDHAGVEKIKTGVDLVGDEHLWLLDESLDLVVFVSDNNTVLGWVLNLGDHDGSLLLVALVEFDHLVKWVVANNIRVKNEEEVVSVVLKDDVLGKSDWSSGTEWLVLERAGDLHVIFLLKDLELFHHHFWLVVDGENNFGNSSCGKSLDLMAKDWEVAEVHQWLWDGQSQWSESGSESTYEN